MTRPEFLYKYRTDDIRALDALFECKAIFSSRKIFNDTFDSLVELIPPTLEELKKVDFANRKSRNPIASSMPTLVDYQGLTKKGRIFLSSFYKSKDKLIDDYRFYCLSANPLSTPMWAHYSSGHKGFCIEFKSEYVGGDKITYKDELPEIRLAEFLLDQRPQFGTDIWEALRTKHTDWSPEKEYRIQPSNEWKSRLVYINADNDSAEYQPEWVESIIFGKDMPDDCRRFIVANCKFPMKFKQVVKGRGVLKITDFR